ncbi:DUF5677 domain-containing protein [Vibrio cholerae]
MELNVEHLPKEHDLSKLVDIESQAVDLMKSVFDSHKLQKKELCQVSSEKLMAYLFTERQIRHTESFALLKKSSDKVLISRTMFEGALFLAYAIKAHNNEVAKKWKLHFYVEHIEHLNDENFPPDLKKQIDENRGDIDRFFRRVNNGKITYSNKWLTTNIHDIALNLDNVCKSMYEQYYRPMAEYHHWSSLSLFQYSHINDSDEGSMTKRVVDTINAYLVSTFSSLLVSNVFLSVICPEGNKEIRRLKEIEDMLNELSFIKTKKVTISTSNI